MRNALLHKSCIKGDFLVLEALEAYGIDANTETMDGSCPEVTLRGNSSQRSQLVTLILKNGTRPTKRALKKAFILRLWDLAESLVSWGGSFSYVEFPSYVEGLISRYELTSVLRASTWMASTS